MKTKSKTGRAVNSPIGTVDREEHYRLRELLADHSPRTYGDLRREHNFSPIFLESQIDMYPEIFEGEVELASGKPTIRLCEGSLESREDILMGRQLRKLIKAAGSNGIYLKNLYLATRFPSKEVQRLLRAVPQVEIVTRRKAAILYKWIENPQKSGIQDHVLSESGQALTVETPPKAEPSNGQEDDPIPADDAELEAGRSKLICLLEKTHRHLDWLENFMDANLIKRLIAKYPEDFESETVDLGAPDLIIRRRAGAVAVELPAAKLAATDIEMSAPQTGPSLLEEIFDEETLAQLRFRPAAPGQCRRRGGTVLKGDRHRIRRPLVTI